MSAIVKSSLFAGLLVVIGLSGCDATSVAEQTYPRWQAAEQPLPPEVLEALPRDIPGQNVIVRLDDEIGGPCYFYQIAGVTHPLPTLRMIEEGLGDIPYCIM